MMLDDVTLSVISDDEHMINNSVKYFLLFSCCQVVIGIATITRYALNGLGAEFSAANLSYVYHHLRF